MLPLYSVEDIRNWDQFTIQNEPITSIDLMERASIASVEWITNHFDASHKIIIFAGPGNNGGDGLAIGRLLSKFGYRTKIYLLQFESKLSSDNAQNLERFKEHIQIIRSLEEIDKFLIDEKTLIIDALFGSGLTRHLEGVFSKTVQYLNKLKGIKIAIDVPSGLFCDKLNGNEDVIFKADHVLSFQIPKRTFLFPENQNVVKKFHVLDIGLLPNYKETKKCDLFYIDQLQRKNDSGKFNHKGSFGHGLIMAGSKGKTGAAILSTKAVLKNGSGLVTSRLPADSISDITTVFPEAMTSISSSHNYISDFPELSPYKAIGIGPGLGTHEDTKKMLLNLLKSVQQPIVLDADALNIIAMENWLNHLPKNAIVTPHPKEFERLFGKTTNSQEALALQLEQSIKHGIYIVKKGAHTSISTPDGKIYFNSTGNPGMGTAGSGDILTGIITSFLTQGYSYEDACIYGVYFHGVAGDRAYTQKGQSITAGDIIDNLY